ncbi:hypothetical protein DRW07_14260 [Alteromonas sediminis]|uniref:UspA domain-containing protein n=1 Tax=Alteromonas sediminis TaxID=2259342 RepID=A0A3N5XXY9_9ALTE|nr:universal stress protein [Alteromonas sediminis]RPJ65967.1 hypothetical protein DRW07_14260 [Alteromonas sediminis]
MSNFDSKQVLLVLNKAGKLDESTLLKAADTAQSRDERLTILCVLAEPDFAMHQHFLQMDSGYIKQKISEATKQTIQATVTKHCPQLSINVEISFGKLYLQAIRYTLKNPVSIVIKSAEDPTWMDSIFDSDDMHLMRKCPVPTWLINTGRHQTPGQVVVALDFKAPEEEGAISEFNRQLLDLTLTFVAKTASSITLIHACADSLADFASIWADDPETMQQQITQQEKVTKRAAMKQAHQYLLDKQILPTPVIKTRLIDGHPEESVAAFVKANNTDMLVLGSLGRTGIKGLFMGNTAESILQQIHCSVITAKPQGFESPIA